MNRCRLFCLKLMLQLPAVDRRLKRNTAYCRTPWVVCNDGRDVLCGRRFNRSRRLHSSSTEPTVTSGNNWCPIMGIYSSLSWNHVQRHSCTRQDIFPRNWRSARGSIVEGIKLVGAAVASCYKSHRDILALKLERNGHLCETFCSPVCCVASRRAQSWVLQYQ